ncbi:MAG: hypothetical protein GY836_13010 [Herbaspirillum sp.]|uniref:hypothetical protein n=1 Tax=Herbaspirillum sp. TaxID=1890675 RepID=UPI0025831521|nr:hypothetical protein [Herbaspirillum sp.]MCP4556334.1 hypothetical protein [Herbaspirillum sp.]
MTLNGTLPGLEQAVIILLFALDASLVLDLSELCGTFLVHAILEVTAHSAISLTHLTKNISLVSLLVNSLLEGVLLMHTVLTINLCINLLLIVLPEPFCLFLHCLLKQNILLTILVNVLEQVDSSLVFTTPLLFTVVPLLFVLFLSQLVNASLISCLIALDVIVMSLELLDFSPAS